MSFGRVTYVRCEYCGMFEGFIGPVRGQCEKCGAPMKMPENTAASYTPPPETWMMATTATWQETQRWNQRVAENINEDSFR